MRVAGAARDVGLSIGGTPVLGGPARNHARRIRLGAPASCAVALAALVAALATVGTPFSGDRASAPARAFRAAAAGSFGRPLPAALAAAASSRIGASSRAFWPVRVGSTLAARAGGIAARFSEAGVRLAAPAGALSFSLESIGRGSRSMPPAAAMPVAHGGEVVYARGAIAERYQAGPYGLEQSFAVREAPLRGGGALVLSLRTAGNLRAHQSGSSLVFAGPTGRPALTLGGLSARDAAGRELPTRLRLDGGAVRLVIADRGARYPIRIDPFFEQGSKLTGGVEETEAGEFGSSVALSADGNTALVGAPGDASNTGAAWVFVRSGTTWEQQGPKLTGSGESGKGRFGFRVALSADGNTALVGAPFDSSLAGAVWVFKRSEGKWEQQGSKLHGGEENGGGEFGIGVALSNDGNTALIGGGSDNSGTGAVWVFTRSEGAWAQQGPKLTGGGEVGSAHVGFNVALSEDGNTAIAGGGADNSGTGAAWVFTRSEGTWTQQGSKLTATGETGAGHFGFSVSLSADGNTALLGGVADNGEVGAAWAFTRSEGKWTQQGSKLTGSGEIGKGLFGSSVDLSSTGNLAVIGASADNANTGAAWIFRRTGEAWEQLGSKLTGSGESGKGAFGAAASISSDASTAIFGANADNSKAGAAWPFANIPLAPTVVSRPASAVTETSATLNATVNPNAETVTDCHFNYGTTPSYGSSAPCVPTPGSGASPVPVSASLTGLKGNTVYHFQIVATNGTGTSESSDQTFATTNPPEFGRCLKLAKGVKGKFSNAGCTLPATAEKFSYEWESGPGPKPAYTTSSSLTTTLETTGKKVVTCKAETGSGEITSGKTFGHVTMTFSGCESAGGSCASSGRAEGEIVTNTLEGALGVEKTSSKGLTSNKIAFDLEPAGASGPVMEFSCGATPVTVRGSVLAPIAANKMVSVATIKYAQTGGKQKPEKFEGLPADVLEAAFGEESFERMGLGATLTQTYAEKIEVNTVV
jgi:hypothetical protein